MRIAIFGGSFNPPHKGHLHSAKCVSNQLNPDLFLIIPDYQPPHKELAVGSPSPEQRLELCRYNFESVENVTISDIEIDRGGKSYTVDTLKQLLHMYPDSEFYLLVGTDMFLNITQWYEVKFLLQHCVIVAFQRCLDELPYLQAKAKDLEQRFGARIEIVQTVPFPASSTEVRSKLASASGVDLLEDAVYSYIVKNKLYDRRVNLDWLRTKSYQMLKPKRIPHVRGCEEEAVRLAKFWGCDTYQAAFAAILHDCTKKEPLTDQLILCNKYGIIPDEIEKVSEKLLHAKTGAAIAEIEFGAEPAIADAIRWHTTGKPNMSLLEKIIYLADYIEPTRDFEGVETLRKLAYSNLNSAMLLGFEMSIEDIHRQGNPVHGDTTSALLWYKELVQKEDRI